MGYKHVLYCPVNIHYSSHHSIHTIQSQTFQIGILSMQAQTSNSSQKDSVIPHKTQTFPSPPLTKCNPLEEVLLGYF